MEEKFGIYVHWPFCKTRCHYCDFFTKVCDRTSQDDLIEEYISDLSFYYDLTKNQKVTSVFFGGGTPSLIEPKNIEKIINFIYKKWEVDKKVEISLEANPNSNHKNMFVDLKNAGINRLSLGIQSLNDEDLKFLGRSHNSLEARKAIDEVLQNFDNHSMDLIYALPHQKQDVWEEDLEKVINFGFKHISLYQLTIEENTPFAKRGVQAMNDEKATDLYNLTTDILASKGYDRYEVSNFAQKGFACSHNQIYWQGYDYVGIGEKAHGRIGLSATTHKRQIEKLGKEDRAVELIMMGLRLKNGIDKTLFKKICGLEFDTFVDEKNIKFLINQGLIENSIGNIKTTEKGFLLLDYVIEKLV